MNTHYQLCFYSGSLSGKIFPIVKEETKIGRDSSCDIILTENSVSRIHVFLYVQQNGSVVLVDNNSTNGTIVNNNQISAPVQLSENDVIGLGGEVMLVFQKVAGFDLGNQWSSKDIPAGNAPDSYNFEKKQGNPMNNENNSFPNDGAMNGFAPNNGMNPQQSADNYGFNQAYNNNFGMPVMNQPQMPYGFNQPNQFAQFDPNGFNNQMPVNSNPAPADNGMSNPAADPSPVSGTSADLQSEKPAEPISQQQMPAGNDAFGSQPQMGHQQNPYAAYPYSQPMGQQQYPYGANPYSQQMMGQQPQMGFGNDPYSQQQMMGQQPQMGFGNDPYNQQQMMGQQPQMGFGNDPYAQQQMMGQQPQMGYGNDPYSQQQMMGQQPQMGFGNDPYAQQQMMGQQPPMGFGNDPYAQQQMMGQQMPYGNNPYGQQQMMGQQMPYGNNPYAQQQYQGTQTQQTEEENKKGSKKKLFIILGIVLLLLILIGAFIFYVDHNRLWCDVFPFLWDADTCANYVR